MNKGDEEVPSRIVDAARRARRPARVAAWISVAAGLLNLISAAFPAEATRLKGVDEYFPGAVSTGAAAVTAVIGIAMLLLAGGLRRRSRNAWFLAVGLLIVSSVGHVLKGLDVEEALLDMFLAGALFGFGEHFSVSAKGWLHRNGPIRRLLAVVFIAAAFGLSGVFAVDRDIGFVDALHQVALMALALPNDLLITGRAEDVLPITIPAVFFGGLVFVLIRLLAPGAKPAASPVTPQEALRSDDSLAWFATREDRSAARAGGAVVAFGVNRAVALAAGDPLGTRSAWPAAAVSFLGAAAEQGRVAAVLACSAEGRALYEQLGLRSVYLGDEAILDLSTFTLDGGAMKTARGSVKRVERAGYTCSTQRVGDIDEETATALRALSDQWREGSAERGFSMALGRLFDERDSDSIIVIGRDGEGVPRGFLHMVPWGMDGASLDVMRRDREAISVLNDYLVAVGAKQMKELGIRRVSLNFSALRGVLVAGAEPDAKWPLRLQRRVLLKLSSNFQIETLYRFNKKFSPSWRPRYLMVEAIEDAPRVMFAALEAEGLLKFGRTSTDESHDYR